MNRTVALILMDFGTGGNVFRKGEFYIAEPNNERSTRTWLTITNLGFEYRASIPMDCVLVVNHASLQALAERGFLVAELTDRTVGSLTKAA